MFATAGEMNFTKLASLPLKLDAFLSFGEYVVKLRLGYSVNCQNFNAKMRAIDENHPTKESFHSIASIYSLNLTVFGIAQMLFAR